MNLQEQAEGYADGGQGVIALNGKAPNGAVHPHGLKDALRLTDRVGDAFRAAFTHPDTTGVGILTEYPYFVIDIDGEEGADQWKDIAGDDYYDSTRVSRTSRGFHLWFADTKARSTRKLGPKLDLKGVGGYVAAPPSVHPDGHIYEWAFYQPGPVREAPEGLITLLYELDWAQERRIVAKKASKRVRQAPKDGWFMPSWGFDGVINTVAVAEEGNRNGMLYWAAYTLSEEGADAEEFAQLYEAGRSAGLSNRETRLTIRSAQRAADSDG